MTVRGERKAGGWRAALDVVSTIVMLVLAGIVIWQGRARLSSAPTNSGNVEAPLPTRPIAIGAGEVLGRAAAPVAIVEYADFECPFCAQFSEQTEPLLVNEYVESGKVQLVFKNFPLPIHARARPDAIAAWCAGRDGKFWKMHDWLFRLRSPQEQDLEERAKDVGIDMPQYHACRAGTEAPSQVDADVAEGEELGVSGTPTFFVGKVNASREVDVVKTFVGGKSMDELRPLLDSLLGG